ncbi:MAG TPA: sensor domain-containing protein [Bryobacteraceae bacterium]|nr:sensor domain-containing protein [Bryobacteraceae bacterium]
MTDTHAIPDSAIDRIFGPIIQRQTWLNVAYLLLSFPLGVAYFVVLTTLICTGFATLAVYGGFFVLLAALAVARMFGNLDRILANGFLDASIPAPAVQPRSGNVFRRLGALLGSPATWKRLIYLYVRFALGLCSLILVCVLIPLSLGLLTLPLTYQLVPINVGMRQVETFDEAIFFCCFGAIFLLLSVHVLNGWTAMCRRFAQRMLTSR